MFFPTFYRKSEEDVESERSLYCTLPRTENIRLFLGFVDESPDQHLRFALLKLLVIVHKMLYV
jgi:hypothetical protein